MQCRDEIEAIGELADHHGCDGHRKQIYKQVVEPQSRGMPTRWHEVVNGGRERSMIPAQEERAQPEKRQERKLTGGMQGEVNCRSPQYKANRNHNSPPPLAEP